MHSIFNDYDFKGTGWGKLNFRDTHYVFRISKHVSMKKYAIQNATFRLKKINENYIKSAQILVGQ